MLPLDTQALTKLIQKLRRNTIDQLLKEMLKDLLNTVTVAKDTN